MSNAPEVRGLFLKALGRPVIVAPSSAEPTVTFDGPLTEVCHDDGAAEGLQEDPAYLGGVTHDVSLS